MHYAYQNVLQSIAARFPPLPPMLTVNMLNYKFDCKYLSEKHITTQGHLTTKSKSVSYLYFKMQELYLTNTSSYPSLNYSAM